MQIDCIVKNYFGKKLGENNGSVGRKFFYINSGNVGVLN
jgi:hypothetical protein